MLTIHSPIARQWEIYSLGDVDGCSSGGDGSVGGNDDDDDYGDDYADDDDNDRKMRLAVAEIPIWRSAKRLFIFRGGVFISQQASSLHIYSYIY